MDRKLIEWTQTAYLWVLDRTGVYLGTVASALYVAGLLPWYAIRGRPPGVIDAVFLVLILALFQRTWRQQHDRRRHAELNAEALAYRESTVRLVLIWSFPAMLALDAVSVYHKGALAMLGSVLQTAVSIFVFVYVDACCVRDREPPERRFTTPATEGSR